MSTRGTVHIDQALTNFSNKLYLGDYIADLIMPRVDVAKESEAYFVYGKNDLRPPDDSKAEKSETIFIDSRNIESSPTYNCEEHALADLVSDRERRNADTPLSPDFDVAENLTEMLALNREKRVADLIINASDIPCRAGFDSPAERVGSIKDLILNSIGRQPNTIVIPSAVSKVLKNNPEVLELIKLTDISMLINGDLPPTMWNMKVLIPGKLWGNKILIAYVAPNPRTLRTMTLGLTPQSDGRTVAKWREEGRKSDAIEVSETLDENIICPYCGCFIDIVECEI